MKRYSFIFIFFFIPVLLTAQSLTGIWQGYFYPDMGASDDTYKYEVQLDHISNKSIDGVTYSYQEKSFYGKANLRGIYMESTRNLVIKEERLLDVKMSPGSEAQIMTCYLTYSKVGNTEYLNGTYSSINEKNGAMGRNGKVFLQRVNKTDFVKEPFLLKRNNMASSNSKQKTLPRDNIASSPSPKTPNQAIGVAPKVKIAGPAKMDSTSPKNTDMASEQKTVPIPSILKERENRLVRKIITSSPDIKIELYDNGEIDGDTITVYHNYQLIANKKGLNYTPVTIRVKATEQDSLHEFIMVANNLGSIPPNTALMVITTGGKRYELFIGTDERRNAKVIIEYRKPD